MILVTFSTGSPPQTKQLPQGECFKSIRTTEGSTLLPYQHCYENWLHAKARLLPPVGEGLSDERIAPADSCRWCWVSIPLYQWSPSRYQTNTKALMTVGSVANQLTHGACAQREDINLIIFWVWGRILRFNVISWGTHRHTLAKSCQS